MTAELARTYPASLPLRVGVAPEHGEVATVGPYRHTVRWAGEGESSVDYCNGCGCGFVGAGSTEVDGVRYAASICPSCREFQGWSCDHPFGPGLPSGV